jgi:DNA-directed RNA polymerase specialized sigma24 family protein
VVFPLIARPDYHGPMAFPQTRHTLIQRLATGADDRDWQEFLGDYWGPVCRFALRRGSSPLAEAEDIASQTFEILLRNNLLARWAASKQAKLRTLLCSVVCKVQANARRARQTGERVLDELKHAQFDLSAVPNEQEVAFLAAWVEDMLEKCLRELAADYHREGKGDYFRVLYGRLCDQMSIAEVAAALEISSSAVDNYYRHVRQRLTERLESAVRSHVYRYAPPNEAESEFAAEWGRLGEYLKEHGGLEDAIRRAHSLVDQRQLDGTKPQRIRDALTRIRALA